MNACFIMFMLIIFSNYAHAGDPCGKTWNIGISDRPGYQEYDKTGAPTGFDVDLFNKVGCQKNGLPLCICPYSVETSI